MKKIILASQALSISGGGAIGNFSAGKGFTIQKADHHFYVTYDWVVPMHIFTDAVLEKSPFDGSSKPMTSIQP